ncbi:MAG TPA: signal peptide peptidase SppA [Spirochaetota bacterium]|nr:signal peptide peptidase SppA [Spirochaetota bacterium]HPJ36409.1 signal peptide peptidase SppA [Spirochaetota bacterium]
MERERKLTVAILAMLILVAVIAIVDISFKIEEKHSREIKLTLPDIGAGIGIVRVEGPIELSSRPGPFGMPEGAEAVVKRLDSLEKDSNIRAVVLRINSPGGTVAATQEIYEKIMKLRKKNIPVVASMGDLAASGGYYVAAACNHIVANYGTVTGSIGVIAYSPNLRRLFDKFGIKMNVIKSGKYKDILASHRDMSRDERVLLQELIDSSYGKFVKDVAVGRNMSELDIMKVADGRIMSGITALENKLVDQMGTFEDAIAKARELAGLDEDSPVYEEKTSPFNEFFGTLNSILRGSSLPGSEVLYPVYKLEYRYMR